MATHLTSTAEVSGKTPMGAFIGAAIRKHLIDTNMADNPTNVCTVLFSVSDDDLTEMCNQYAASIQPAILGAK